MLIRLKLVLAVAAACLPASQVSLGSVMGRLEVCSTLEVFVKGHPPLFSQLLAAAMLLPRPCCCCCASMKLTDRCAKDAALDGCSELGSERAVPCMTDLT